MERILVSKIPACPTELICGDSGYDGFGGCIDDDFVSCVGGITASIPGGASTCVYRGMEFDLAENWEFNWDGTNECIGEDNNWSYYYVRAGVGRSP